VNAELRRLFAEAVVRATPGSDLYNMQTFRISESAWLDEFNFFIPPERDFKTIKHQVPYLCHTSIIGPSNLELTRNESGKMEAALTAAFALKWVETIFEYPCLHDSRPLSFFGILYSSL